MASQVDIWADKINRLVLQKGIGTGESYTILPCDNGEAAMQNLHHAVKQFGYEAGGWRVENHPRFLADLTGDGRLDIVGFANNGVLVSLNNGDGTFREPELVLSAFGWDHDWRVDKHPRFLADLTGDGRADIVGFFDDGVWVAFNNGDGGFNEPELVLTKFWNIAESYFETFKNGLEAVFLADLTGNGRPDIVFFDRTGVLVALNQVGLGDKPFSLAELQPNLGRFAAGQSADIGTMCDLRFLVDLTGDGCADIVAFGADGVWVALSNGDGTFTALERKLEAIGDNLEVGGWRADKHPRFLADVTGNGRPDIVGFGDAGVYVALNNGDGTFQSEKLVSSGFGHLPAAGNWLVENHPRFLADVTGDGRADIVGFANSGVVVALNKGDGTFQEPRLVLSAFGHDKDAGGWDVKYHPRFLADLSGDGRSDIVGFANDGVWVGTLYGAFGSSLTEIASLGRPVFYQDKRHAFFVEPTLAEPTADEWEGWVPSPGRPEAPSVDAGSIAILPEISAFDPKAPIWNPPVVDKESILQRGHTFDWIVNQETLLEFDQSLIGPGGQVTQEILSPGNELGGAVMVATLDDKGGSRFGLRDSVGQVNIVGRAGFNQVASATPPKLSRAESLGATSVVLGRTEV